MSTRQQQTIAATTPPSRRWVCPCQHPPVLLATWEPSGRVNIKVRDRYWHFTGFGQVTATCPRCATEHILDLAPFAPSSACPGGRIRED